MIHKIKHSHLNNTYFEMINEINNDEKWKCDTVFVHALYAFNLAIRVILICPFPPHIPFACFTSLNIYSFFWKA